MWKLSVKQGEKLVQVYDLPEQGLTIGRSAGCTVQVNNKRVSGRHARVYLENGACYIQDLDSTNGTYLNDELIQCVPFKPGDQVEVADYCLMISEVEQQSEPGASEQTRYHSAAVIEEALVGGIIPLAKKKFSAETHLRRGETDSGTIPFRVGRYFSVNGEWFFSTREAQDMGPFLTLDAAKAAFTEYGLQLGFDNGSIDIYPEN